MLKNVLFSADRFGFINVSSFHNIISKYNFRFKNWLLSFFLQILNEIFLNSLFAQKIRS